MLYALAFILLLAVVSLPQAWVKWALSRHGADRPDLPGTGGELAEHLVAEFGLEGVRVEQTPAGDHYDPQTRTVRLSPAHHGGRSVAAVAVAAHEVGHALQHAARDRWLDRRQRLAHLAIWTDRLAGIVFIAAPLLGVAARVPVVMIALVGLGIALLGVRVLFNVITLPVEFDASFGKALPILTKGRYLHDSDMPAARTVLRAAALTYVAGALISLVDLARWIRLLR
ncbi:peptidase [Zhengella mangrovi]|uniref:Peptidase n=1 Tax=Zhengella mangrovi TaxID=1982044 RepID=A0A2G1QP45_9HYPH|nr:zinc metallopeptidase [Zhengella mangrovi]PHP67241.1 peptidase [Zhengella mangrovi]